MNDTPFKPIFVSYRRSDDAFAAVAVYDKLAAVFGPEQIFKDVDSFEPGDDFPTKLAEFVEQSDVLLAIIGPRWLTAQDELGRRLDNPLDWVRIEIASALEQNKRVVPVLVSDAQMPSAEDLPENLKPLRYKHAVRISADTVGRDLQALAKSLEPMLAEAKLEREDAQRKAEAEAQRRAEEEAARAREAKAKAKAQQAAQQNSALTSSEVAAMRAIQNWDYIKSRSDIDEHRDHIARFPEDDTARFAWTALDHLVWNQTDQNSVESLDAYLAEFGTGGFAEAAAASLEKLREEQARLAEARQREQDEKAAWAEVAAQNDKEAFRAFLVDYPDGRYAADAKKRLGAMRLSRRNVVLSGLSGAGLAGLATWQLQPGNWLWTQIFDQSELTLVGHDGSVLSVAYSPDGTRIVSGSSDGTLRIWA